MRCIHDHVGLLLGIMLFGCPEPVSAQRQGVPGYRMVDIMVGMVDITVGGMVDIMGGTMVDGGILGLQ